MFLAQKKVNKKFNINGQIESSCSFQLLSLEMDGSAQLVYLNGYLLDRYLKFSHPTLEPCKTAAELCIFVC